MFAIFVLTLEVCILSVHGFKGWVLSNKEVSLASLFLPAASLKFGKSCFALDVRMSFNISVAWFPDTTFLIRNQWYESSDGCGGYEIFYLQEMTYNLGNGISLVLIQVGPAGSTVLWTNYKDVLYFSKRIFVHHVSLSK